MRQFVSFAQAVDMLQAPPKIVEKAIQDLGIEQVEVNHVRHIDSNELNRLAARLRPSRNELAYRANALQ